MKLPFSPHLLVLLCSGGLFAASGVILVKNHQAETVTPSPAPIAQPAATVYSTAQIDRWVAPIALYPDPLLSQVLMASTYPDSVAQAVRWSQAHPTLKGDPALQAAANQPWDASVKSLVAFPSLMALMGEDPQWVANLGNAFLAQPQDVMDSVQKLRALAQQTGSLQSTPQQTVTTAAKPVVVQHATGGKGPAPQSTTSVIRIEPTNPQVVYVPNYNPGVVYGSWPNAALPPVYLPPPPGVRFADSVVQGLGFGLGVATTYALFSNSGDSMTWQHNPQSPDNRQDASNALAQQVHRPDAPAGLSAAAPTSVNAARDSQRQAAMTQLQQRTNAPAPAAGQTQRQAAMTQLQQHTNAPAPAAGQTQRQAANNRQPVAPRHTASGINSSGKAQPRQDNAHLLAQRPAEQRREPLRQHSDSRIAPMQRAAGLHAQARGSEGRNISGLNNDRRETTGEDRVERRPLRHL